MCQTHVSLVLFICEYGNNQHVDLVIMMGEGSDNQHADLIMFAYCSMRSQCQWQHINARRIAIPLGEVVSNEAPELSLCDELFVCSLTCVIVELSIAT